MKVLLIHNFYQSSSPSGEDIVFRNEVDLLRNNGVEVVTYEKHNDDIVTFSNKLKAAFGIIWSGRSYRDLKNLIRKEKPALAHFHNFFYLISPSAYYACKEEGIPVVQTLHNYRLFCVNGLLGRKGRICEECVGKLPWRGVMHGCYRDSRLYSIPVALTAAFHKIAGTWNKKVDAYITLSTFARNKLIKCGLPAEKLFVKPNFFENPPQPSFENDGYAVFVGRVSSEKGLSVIIDAMNVLNTLGRSFHIKIIGDGPLKSELEQEVSKKNISGIEFTGKLSQNRCIELIRRSMFLIIPSVWYEGFPLVVREAFVCGKPIISSRIGALDEIIEDGKTGLLFEPGDADDLASKIEWMLDNEDARIEMCKNARAEFEEKYTAGKNLEMLMDIYQKVLKKK